MAATYSSFMTTRYYSPVFNTALFDGPLRIYFSQSYETVALKIYHLLQSQHEQFWNQLKQYSANSKEHLFLMIYPEAKDLGLVFNKTEAEHQSQEWDEGLAVGIVQAQTDDELKKQLEYILASAIRWMAMATEAVNVQI
jgi:hypothetical protein